MNIKIVEALNRLQWDAPHWRPNSWLCRLRSSARPGQQAIAFLYFNEIIHLNPDGACVNASKAQSPTKSGKCLKLIWVAWPVKKRIIPGVCVVLELFYNIADCSQDLLFPFKALHFVAFDVASGQGLSGIIMTVYHIVPISILTHLLTPSAQSRTDGGLGKELGTSLYGGSLYWIKVVFTAALNSNR